MERMLEPEVMEDAERARAYAKADFSQVNQAFVARFLARFPQFKKGAVLDLGCGPADIPMRLARARAAVSITAVDASDAMLNLATEALSQAHLEDRVRLVCARLPGLPLAAGFDAIVSNSLAHHLPDPQVLWREILRLGRPGSAVFVMDLFRPQSPRRARQIVDGAAAQEHPLLQEDFYNSLRAAFTLEEVQEQLDKAGLALQAEIVSDRHWLVAGRLNRKLHCGG